MKRFLAVHFILALAALFLLSIVLAVVFLFFLKPRVFVQPSLSLIETKDNHYTLKNSQKISYGFLPYWSVGNYSPNFDAVTDIVYFTFFLNSDGSIKKFDENGSLDPSYNTWQSNGKLQTIIKESHAEGVRVSLTIAIHDNEGIENFLNCTKCWENSYAELNTEVSKQGILGLNLDFEYVGDIPPGLDKKYADYATFLSNKFKKSHGNNFIVVVSTYADAAYKNRLMNLKYLNIPEIDYLFIMAYDFYRPTSDTSGPVAPISGAPQKYEYDLTLMIKDYLQRIPSSKLILGVPFYGYNWIVSGWAPYSKRIPGNDYIGYSVSQHYDAIKEKIDSEGLNVLWDEDAKSPYFTYYNYGAGVIRQVFFENQESVKEKIELAEKSGFAGVGAWALGYEGPRSDFTKLLEDYIK